MDFGKIPSGKLDVKLVALDLDDTLLNDDCVITERTAKILRRAVAQGIYIVLCSGRAENGMLSFVKQLDIAGTNFGRYLIAYNGALIFDLHKRLPIFENSVDPEILKFVYSEAKKRDMSSIVYGNSIVYSWRDTEWARTDAKLCNL